LRERMKTCPAAHHPNQEELAVAEAAAA
jgi:hypothetical protein